jgi:hypothetical protein
VRRVVSYLLIVVVLVGAGTYLWQYRKVSVAPSFMPRTSVRVIVPAGTQIPGILKNLVTSTTQPGDTMPAFVTDPVMINGSIAIPLGARLDGVVEKITKANSHAETWVRFNLLVIDGKNLRVETDPVRTTTTVTTDFEVLGDVADTLTQAGVGAAMGAASKNPASVNAGVAVGALRGAAGVQEVDTKVTVVLAQPVEVIR